MKHTTLYGDDFEDRMGSALGGMGMLYLGIGCVLNHIDLDKVVPPDGLLTTAQVIELVGVPALSGLLGCAIGAALNQWVSAHTEPVLRASEQAVRRVDFTALPRAIGNTKGTLTEKLCAITQAIQAKGTQIAAAIKDRVAQQTNEYTQ